MKFHIQRSTALFHEFCIIYNIFIPDSYSFQNWGENRKFTFNFRFQISSQKLNWRINARIYQAEEENYDGYIPWQSLSWKVCLMSATNILIGVVTRIFTIMVWRKKVKTWMGILLQKLSLMASIFSGAVQHCVMHYLAKHAFW